MGFTFQAYFILLGYAFFSSIVKSRCSCKLTVRFFFFPRPVCMQFKPEEVAAIIKDFDEPGSLAPTGLHLGGTKYMVIQGEPGAVIRGKKVFFKLY